MLLRTILIAIILGSPAVAKDKNKADPDAQVSLENKLAIREAQIKLLSIAAEKAQIELRLHILAESIPAAQQAVAQAQAAATPVGYTLEPDFSLKKIEKTAPKQ